MKMPQYHRMEVIRRLMLMVSVITHYFIRMNMIRLSIVQNMITVVRQQQQATDIRQASHPYRLQH